jgi:hypothetical protein
VSASLALAVHERMSALVEHAYDGEVPRQGGGTEGPPVDETYAVLWADPGRRYSDDMASSLLAEEHRFQITSVGISAEQARMTAQRCRDGLLTWTPTVDGATFGPPAHETTSAARRQGDDLPSALFLVVDTYVVYGARPT